MINLRDYLSRLCGKAEGERIFELLSDCYTLRSDWAIIAYKGKGAILSMTIAEDEPMLEKVRLIKVVSPDEDWGVISEIANACYSPRIVKQRDVVIFICEDEEPGETEIKEAVCRATEPTILCTSEWL